MLMKFKGIRVLGGVAGCWVSLSIVFLMELVYLHTTATNIPSATPRRRDRALVKHVSATVYS